MTGAIDRVLSMVRLGCSIILLDEEKVVEEELICTTSGATPEVIEYMIRLGDSY